MTNKILKIPPRHLLLGALAILLPLCGLIGLGLSLSHDESSDSQKLREVYRMYDGYRKSFPDVKEVSPQEAMHLVKENRVLFVDVRTPEEQEISMLPSAITEEDYLSNSDKYRDKTIIGYCTISYRSGKLAEKLGEEGLEMLNLKGGMLAWVLEGGKVYDESGETMKIHVYGRKWDYAPQGYKSVW
jgi:sodium/bile acid cotransporter 7